MNLTDGKLVREGGVLFAKGRDLRVPVDEERFGKSLAEGRAVTIGVRPHDFVVREEGRRRAAWSSRCSRRSASRPTPTGGSRQAGPRFVVRLHGDELAHARVGERLPLAVPKQHVHLFDAKTGRRSPKNDETDASRAPGGAGPLAARRGGRVLRRRRAHDRRVARVPRRRREGHPAARAAITRRRTPASASSCWRCPSTPTSRSSRRPSPHGHGPDVFIEAHERSHVYQRHMLLAPVPFALDDDYDPVVTAAVTQDGVRIAIPLSTKCVALYVRTDRGAPRPPRTMEELLATPLPAGVFPLAYEANNAYLHAAHPQRLRRHRWSTARQLLLRLERGHLVDALRARRDGPDEDPRRADRRARDAALRQRQGRGGHRRPVAPRGSRRRASPTESCRSPRSRAHSRCGRCSPSRPRCSRPTASTRPDALDFARFLGSREAAITLATVGHQVVARHAAWTDPALTSDKALVAFHEAVRDAIPTSASEAMNVRVGARQRGAPQRAPRRGRRSATLAEAHRRFDDAMKPPPPARSPGTSTSRSVSLGLGPRLPRGEARAPAGLPPRSSRRRFRRIATCCTRPSAIVVLVILPLTRRRR